MHRHGNTEPSAFGHCLVKFEGKFGVTVTGKPVFVVEFPADPRNAVNNSGMVRTGLKVHLADITDLGTAWPI